jgi:hypothetical protein
VYESFDTDILKLISLHLLCCFSLSAIKNSKDTYNQKNIMFNEDIQSSIFKNTKTTDLSYIRRLPINALIGKNSLIIGSILVLLALKNFNHVKSSGKYLYPYLILVFVMLLLLCFCISQPMNCRKLKDLSRQSENKNQLISFVIEKLSK